MNPDDLTAWPKMEELFNVASSDPEKAKKKPKPAVKRKPAKRKPAKRTKR